METKNQTAQESAQSGVVDYAAALRQYHRYGRGRSVKKFCEDEGYDYWKFCKAGERRSERDGCEDHRGQMEMMLTPVNKEDFPEHISRFLSIPLRRLNIVTSIDVPDHFRIPYYM